MYILQRVIEEKCPSFKGLYVVKLLTECDYLQKYNLVNFYYLWYYCEE